MPATNSTVEVRPNTTTLHVECCTKETETSPKLRADEVEAWLRSNFVSLHVGQSFESFRKMPQCLSSRIGTRELNDVAAGMHNSENLDYVRIADVVSNIVLDTDLRALVSVQVANIAVNVFHLHSFKEEVDQAEDDMPKAKVTLMPSEDFRGEWNSLIFEDQIHFKLLNFILRMLSFSTRQDTRSVTRWNRLLLLYGPSGTGKSSLSRALAQQLSIRLKSQYQCTKLVEIDANSLFSRYFGETGKFVGKIFADINSMLDAKQNTFICVFIDEVESLASARQRSAESNEPRDSLRAVNALLIGLDHLRYRPNVFVICASNLIEEMDPAFIDRVDTKQYIPYPCARACYEIYRSCYIDLFRCGIVLPPCVTKANADSPAVVAHDDIPSITSRLEKDTAEMDKNCLPEYNILCLRYWNHHESLPWRLWNIAENSVNLSGRTLCRLPVLALALHCREDPCSIDEALAALAKAVKEELMMKTAKQ